MSGAPLEHVGHALPRPASRGRRHLDSLRGVAREPQDPARRCGACTCAAVEIRRQVWGLAYLRRSEGERETLKVAMLGLMGEGVCVGVPFPKNMLEEAT